MRTVAVINQKGGCGKTTTAINLSGILAKRGLRTLLVDLDPQSHCAAGLAIPEQRIDLDIGDAMLADDPGAIDPARLVWRVCRNLDLAPSRTRLATLEAPRGGLAEKPDKERRLSAYLAARSAHYDAVVIDCSPAIGLLAFNAMAAADEIIVPVETSYFSLQGATKQIQTIRSLEKRLSVRAPAWLLPTLHDENSALSRDLLGELERRFAGRVLPVVIRLDASLREAASFGQPVVDYAPRSRGAADYNALADWACARWGLPIPDRAPDRVHERGLDPTDTPNMHGDAAPSADIDLKPLIHADAAAALSDSLRSAADAMVMPGPDSPGPDEAEPALPLPTHGADAPTNPNHSPSPCSSAGAPTGDATSPPGAAASDEAARRGDPWSALDPDLLPPPSEPAASEAAADARLSIAAMDRSPPGRHEDQRGEVAGRVASSGAAPPVRFAADTAGRIDPARSSYPALTLTDAGPGSMADREPASAPPLMPQVRFTPLAGRPGRAMPALRRPLKLAGVGPASRPDPTHPPRPGVSIEGADVVFRQPRALGLMVCVAGDFNNWSPIGHPMRPNPRTGGLELRLLLPPGRRAYRLVVDGRWTADPFNPNVETNPFGELNSIVDVPAPPQQAVVRPAALWSPPVPA